MLNTGNGQIQAIEPLHETQTNMNVEINEKELTAPLGSSNEISHS